MIDGVTTDFLNGLGVVGVVVLVGIAIIRGWLVTKRQYDEALHDRDEWRTEARLKDSQIAEKDKQLGHMEEVGRTVNAIMQSIGRGRNRANDQEVP